MKVSSWFRAWPDFVVPFAMKLVPFQIGALRLRVGYFAPDRVFASIQTAGNLQALSFALQRPLRGQAPQEVSVGKDSVSLLYEAAKMLRQESTQIGVEVEGLVVKLESSAAGEGGRVVISSDLEGRVRPVGLELAADDYRVAIEAHAKLESRDIGRVPRVKTSRPLTAR